MEDDGFGLKICLLCPEIDNNTRIYPRVHRKGDFYMKCQNCKFDVEKLIMLCPMCGIALSEVYPIEYPMVIKKHGRAVYIESVITDKADHTGWYIVGEKEFVGIGSKISITLSDVFNDYSYNCYDLQPSVPENYPTELDYENKFKEQYLNGNVEFNKFKYFFYYWYNNKKSELSFKDYMGLDPAEYLVLSVRGERSLKSVLDDLRKDDRSVSVS